MAVPNRAPVSDIQETMVNTKTANRSEITPMRTEGDGEIIEKSDQDHTDIGYGFYQESLEMDPVERQILAKKVKKKLDFILLPMMCFVYFLSFMDKSSLNYANAYGLQADLHLVGRDYSWIASVTNFGYLFAAWPMTVVLQKFPIGKVIGSMLTLWGVILMFTALAKSFAGMMVLRFILGSAEAGIGPAWMLLTSMFWTRDEQPLRMAFWLGCNGISTIVGAGVSWGLGHTNNAVLRPWQLVFVAIGAATFCFGMILVFILPSTPIDCIFFSREEALASVWRVSHNRTGVKHGKILWYQVVEAFVDLKVYFIFASALCLGIINGATANFWTTILKSFGYSNLKSVLYQMPCGAFQFIGTIIAGTIASKVPNSLVTVVFLGYVPGMAGLIGILTIPLRHQLNLAACAWIMPITGLCIILTWSIVAANIAGHTKRTFVNGLEFVGYAAGNIIGPFLFIPSEAPRYPSAIKGLLSVHACAMLFTACLGLVMLRENRKRAKEDVPSELVDDAGLHDFTDFENRGFLYKL